MDQINTLKIFMVDDDAFSLSLSAQHILNLGYTDVSTFDNGTDCLSSLVLKPDVIFLDHTMDTLSGFDVLKKIKRFNPNIYVVMLSGQEDLKTAIDSMKYGAFDYLIKGDNEYEKMKEVMNRIEQVRELIKKSKYSFLKAMFSFM